MFSRFQSHVVFRKVARLMTKLMHVVRCHPARVWLIGALSVPVAKRTSPQSLQTQSGRLPNSGKARPNATGVSTGFGTGPASLSLPTFYNRTMIVDRPDNIRRAAVLQPFQAMVSHMRHGEPAVSGAVRLRFFKADCLISNGGSPFPPDPCSAIFGSCHVLMLSCHVRTCCKARTRKLCAASTSTMHTPGRKTRKTAYVSKTRLLERVNRRLTRLQMWMNFLMAASRRG